MDRKIRMLVIDDDSQFQIDLTHVFQHGEGFLLDRVTKVDELEKKLDGIDKGIKDQGPIELILLDLVWDERKPDIYTGLEWIQKLKKRYDKAALIVVTNAENNANLVDNAVKRGADDYLSKDITKFRKSYWTKYWKRRFEINVYRKRKDLEELTRKIERIKSKQYPFIGKTPAVLKVKHQLKLIAENADITVLITGETGVGKEVAVRYLHQNSPRKNKKFIAVNLSAIQKDLLESALFGHRKGGFTGATKDMDGYFEQANNGIILLDEIGDIDASIQIKLLRLMEQKIIRPVGSNQDIRIDVQIVVATHRDLAEEVREGRFRNDLYQRLKTMIVKIPPLRERKQDIPLIMRHYLTQRLGKVKILEVMEKEAYDKLIAYDWKGNIRELCNAINSMLLYRKLNNSPKVTIDCLPEEIRNYSPLQEILNDASEQNGSLNLGDLSKEEEHALQDLNRIETALIACDGRRGHAAKQSGFKNTDNVRYRLKTIHAEFPHLFEQFPKIREVYWRVFR